MAKNYRVPQGASFTKLVRKVAKSSGYLEFEIKEIIAHTVAQMLSLMSEHGAVRIENLGTFCVVERNLKERQSNLKHLNGMKIGGPRKLPRFIPTRGFKEHVKTGIVLPEVPDEIKNDEKLLQNEG